MSCVSQDVLHNDELKQIQGIKGIKKAEQRIGVQNEITVFLTQGTPTA